VVLLWCIAQCAAGSLCWLLGLPSCVHCEGPWALGMKNDQTRGNTEACTTVAMSCVLVLTRHAPTPRVPLPQMHSNTSINSPPLHCVCVCVCVCVSVCVSPGLPDLLKATECFTSSMNLVKNMPSEVSSRDGMGQPPYLSRA